MSRRWLTGIAAVAMVAVAAAPAAAGTVTSSGPFALSARDDVTLGVDTLVAIAGRPPAGAALRWVASAGSIAPPAGGGDGVVAELSLPDGRRPQVVIVAALDGSGAIVDWLAIPVAAQAQIRVETERRAQVIVEVGGREFGPVRADRAGVASVPIVVPPGVEVATTRTSDTAGNVREEVVALGTPPFAQTLAVCARDGRRVQIVAVSSTGLALVEAPTLIASAGALGAPVALAPGVFEVAFDVAGADPGEVVVTARTGEEDAVASSCALEVAAPPVEIVSVAEAPRAEPLRAEPPRAPPRARRWQLALRSGWIGNLARVSAPILAVDATVAVPGLGGRVRAGLELGGYRATSDVPDPEGEMVAVTITAAPVLARVLYRQPVGRGAAWIGLGGGAVIAATRLSSPATGLGTDRQVVPAGSVFSGAMLPVGPGAITGELGYLHARADGDVHGRIGGVIATIGYALSY